MRSFARIFLLALLLLALGSFTWGQASAISAAPLADYQRMAVFETFMNPA